MNLKGKLHNLKKGADTVDLYLQKIKVIRDILLAVGVIIDDEELLQITIKGLPKEYNAFRFVIRTRSTQLSFDELSTMLNAEEKSFNEGLDVKDPIFALAATSTSKPNGNYNQYSRGRGKGNTTTEMEEEVEAQIVNHLTSINFHNFSQTSPIQLLLVPDQEGQLVRSMASLDI